MSIKPHTRQIINFAARATKIKTGLIGPDNARARHIDQPQRHGLLPQLSGSGRQM